MRVCRIATCSGKLIMLSRFPYRLINHNRKLEIHMDGYGVIHPLGDVPPKIEAPSTIGDKLLLLGLQVLLWESFLP